MQLFADYLIHERFPGTWQLLLYHVAGVSDALFTALADGCDAVDETPPVLLVSVDAASVGCELAVVGTAVESSVPLSTPRWSCATAAERRGLSVATRCLPRVEGGVWCGDPAGVGANSSNAVCASTWRGSRALGSLLKSTDALPVFRDDAFEVLCFIAADCLIRWLHSLSMEVSTVPRLVLCSTCSAMA